MNTIKFTEALTPAQLELWKRDCDDYMLEKAARHILAMHNIVVGDLDDDDGRYDVDITEDNMELKIYPEETVGERERLQDDLRTAGEVYMQNKLGLSGADEDDEVFDSLTAELDAGEALEDFNERCKDATKVYRVEVENPPAWVVFLHFVDVMAGLMDDLCDPIHTVKQWDDVYRE